MDNLEKIRQFYCPNVLVDGNLLQSQKTGFDGFEWVEEFWPCALLLD
jgi:hypothetical protein